MWYTPSTVLLYAAIAGVQTLRSLYCRYKVEMRHHHIHTFDLLLHLAKVQKVSRSFALLHQVDSEILANCTCA